MSIEGPAVVVGLRQVGLSQTDLHQTGLRQKELPAGHSA